MFEGVTLHSLLYLPLGRELTDLRSGMKLSNLQARFSAIRVHLIDEYSMVGCKFLSRVDQRLRQATGNSRQLFGGLSVILAGDTKQLQPVMDTPLWGNPNTAEGLAGKAAFSEFLDVVELVQLVRQGSADQQPFRDLLNRLRIGKSNLNDWLLLRTRMLGYFPSNETDKYNNSLMLMPLKNSVENHNSTALNALVNAPDSDERICRINAVVHNNYVNSIQSI